ncbi:MAG: hypothetical protein U5R06_10900 [candidate division KSB1 bacterium]|nr:hypothetical protein [candidate division KSB1 bacterium]
MQNSSRIPKCIILMLFLAVAASTGNAQIIFRTEKPLVKTVWHRVADFSPTLRSVEAAEISPDGKHVISGSKFGYYLMLWRVADGELVWETVMDAEIECVTFSPDGKLIAAGDEAYTVTIFDLNGNIVRTLQHDAAFDGITWCPDGQYVAGGSENGEVVLWNTRTWEKEHILDAGATVNSLQFTRNADKLIAAGNQNNPDPDHDWDRHGFVKAWDVSKDWDVIFEIRAQEKSSKSVRFSPDEQSFAVAGFANQIKVFSFPEAKELAVIDVPEKLEAIAFHPEGNFIFAGGHGDEMRVYKAGSYKQVSTFPCRRVEYIHFSQDGRLMVTGHEDSGLLILHMLISNVQSSEDYHKLSNEILQNKDLK